MIAFLVTSSQSYHIEILLIKTSRISQLNQLNGMTISSTSHASRPTHFVLNQNIPHPYRQFLLTKKTQHYCPSLKCLQDLVYILAGVELGIIIAICLFLVD